MTEFDLTAPPRHPYRWGSLQTPGSLPEGAAGALSALGAVPAAPAVPPEEAELPPDRLADDVRDELVAVLGREHLRVDAMSRVAHTRGYSTPDLLRLRAGDAGDAPDAVVYPATHEEVLATLQICARHRVAVVPYAGGTSVVGGLAPARTGFAAVVAIDTCRLDRLLAVDDISRTAHLQAGLRGVAAEQLLGERGYTLGHFPQSYEMATIGGYAAARSAGQSSAGYGRFDEMVVGLTLATPRGTVELGTAPLSATGPDLRQLILGSEGIFGVITSVVVRIRPRPDVREFEGWQFADFAAAVDAVRALAQDGPLPTVLRLSDEVETAVNLADPEAALGSPGSGGCLLIAGYEGSVGHVATLRDGVRAVLGAHGGQPRGAQPGEAWRLGRFRGPYLRDPLLEAGALVETLETATFWSNLTTLKSAVTEALQTALTEQGTPSLVLCHISHVYETGASLYFTVVTRQLADPIEQWALAKRAANAAIRSSGAAISHHHGVGVDHRETFAEEVGPIAVDMLRAVKASVDPAGILNPGILIG